jgi:hypothetical protein
MKISRKEVKEIAMKKDTQVRIEEKGEMFTAEMV